MTRTGDLKRRIEDHAARCGVVLPSARRAARAAELRQMTSGELVWLQFALGMYLVMNSTFRNSPEWLESEWEWAETQVILSERRRGAVR